MVKSLKKNNEIEGQKHERDQAARLDMKIEIEKQGEMIKQIQRNT